MISNFIDGIRSFAGDPLGIANATAGDASTQSPNRDPPAPPSSSGSALASKQEADVIDLSSPPTESIALSTQQEFTGPYIRKPRITDDEKRLVGDFRTPADAVALPNPQSWMTGAEFGHGTIHNKPGSTVSFRPVNTINDVNPGPGGRKQITYSKQHRPLIGHERHGGQEAYLAKMNAGKLATPARHLSSRRKPSGSSDGASPGKRRKTAHVIDLEHDDGSEPRNVSPPFAPHTIPGTSRTIPPSNKSSQSHFTVASASTVNVKTRSKTPKSEFDIVNSITNPHRKRARRSSSNINQGTRHMSPFGGGTITTHKQHSPIESLNNHLANNVKTPRQEILEDFSQGHTNRPAKERKQRSDTFPNMRINESTAEEIKNGQRAVVDNSTLRKQYIPAPTETIDFDGSEDELARSGNYANEAPRKRVNSLSKTRKVAGSKVPRKAGNKASEKAASLRWPLAFARTHGFESRGSEMSNGHYNLMLRNEDDGWRVTTVEHATGNSKTQVKIRNRDIVKAQADDTRRIRLEGSRRPDGNYLILDLEFVNTSDHVSFRDDFAKSLVASNKVYIKQEDTMIMLFKKPLLQNEKVGISELIDHPIPEANSSTLHKPKHSRAFLADQLKSTSQSIDSNTLSKRQDISTAVNPAARTSTRIARSTRSSAPDYDMTDSIRIKEVSKFSIDVGLGKPWPKPLEYGKGRQRAVVHFEDLQRLDEEEFLNDSLIDFYMIYLFNKFKVPSDKVYFFNTYFFTQLTKNTGRQSMNYKAVERWTSRIDVFSYDYLIVPINEATHWYLAIICNVSNIDRKPVFESFDSDLTKALELSRQDQADPMTLTERNSEGIIQATAFSRPVHNAIVYDKEQKDDDLNLFDEESKLDLIDRDETGEGDGPRAGNDQALSVPHSTTGCTTNNAHVAIGDVAAEDAVPKGILSNLATSPGSKRSKRRLSQMKKDPNQPIILILDSLGQTRSGTVRALKDWLMAEGEAKRGMEATIKEKGYYPKSSQIPIQENWTDCGVYLLGYVEKFFHDPDEFKTKLLTGEMSADEDWPELKPKEMRNNMRDIIFEAAKEQHTQRKKDHKATKGVVKAKTTHSPVKSGPTKSGIDKNRPGTVNSGAVGHMEGLHTGVEQAELNIRPPSEPAKPRLGSPFKFDPPLTGDISRSPEPTGVEKVSDSPPIEASSPRNVFTSASVGRTPRQERPEVRIMSRTPQSTALRRKSPTRPAEVPRQDKNVMQQEGYHRSHRQSDSSGHEKDNGKLRLPSAKRQPARSSPHQTSDVVMFSHSLKPHNGQSSPLPVTASQKVKLNSARMSSHQPFGINVESKNPTKLTDRRPELRASPSFEEISPSAYTVPKQKHHLNEEQFTGHELLVSLDKDDHERRKFRRSRSRSPTVFSRHFPMDSAGHDNPEPMEVDVENRGDVGDEMEIDTASQEIEVQDTPEPNRLSPGATNRWKMDNSLSQ